MPFSRVTFAQLKSESLACTGNATFFTSDEIGRWINEGLRLWQLFTGYWRTSKTLTGQANIAFYRTSDNPSALLRPLRVSYNGTVLNQETMIGADLARPGWQGTAPGTPLRWFPVGISRICLHPAPSVSGGSIVVEGLARAPILALDADYIDLNETLFNALQDYVSHIAAFKQGAAELSAATSKYRSFITAASEQNQKFRNSSIYRKALGLDVDARLRPIYGRTNAVRRRA